MPRRQTNPPSRTQRNAKRRAVTAPRPDITASPGIGHNQPPVVIAPVVLEPLFLRRREACVVLNVGMTKLKEMLRDKELPEIRHGKLSLIPLSAIRALNATP